MTKSDKRNLVKRLYELANGAEPKSRLGGICYDALSINGGFKFMSDLFVKPNILGDAFTTGDRWEGERGHVRRTLAGLAAAYIETEL